MQSIEITGKERICLECLRQGKSQEVTASIILVSVTKVERIYRDLRDRFGCDNNYQLLAFAYEHGILSKKEELPSPS